MCFFKNVEGHITLGLSTVISDLEELGYQTTWGIFSASEVGAPHQRKRVFILAYNQRQRIEELSRWIADESQQHSPGYNGCDVWPSRPGEPQHESEPPRVVANSESQRAGRGHQLCGEDGRPRRTLPCESDESGEVLADTSIVRCDRRPNGISGRIWEPAEANEDATGCGGEGNGMRQAESSMGRDTDGPTD
ncbi:MAG: DNA cytosine methyltransferase [Alphaproteobacteria bacterium]